MKNGSGGTKSAPACRWTAAKAGSNSASVPAVITWSCPPTARAVSCISVVLITVFGLFGFTRKATVAAVGTSSQSSSSCFAISVKDNRLTPITLPPGRLRLATRPSFMGSLPVSKTIGMVRGAALYSRECRGVAAGRGDHHHLSVDQIGHQRRQSLSLDSRPCESKCLIGRLWLAAGEWFRTTVSCCSHTRSAD
jgi:hypothetical protein